MQGRLLIFKPAIIERDDALPLTETSANTRWSSPEPIPRLFRSSCRRASWSTRCRTRSSLRLLGAYTTVYEVKDGHLHFSRSLLIKSTTIPGSEWAKVKQFFDSIRRAEGSPVVLARK